MKKLFLLITSIVFLQFTSLAQEGWFWQNPLPQGNDLNDVWVFNENNTICIGEEGTTIKTTDGGMSWTKIDLSFDRSLNSIYFVDSNNGWIAGDCGVVFRTTDSGDNWELVKTDTLCGTLNIVSLHFIDINTGWILEYYEEDAPPWLLKTTDGGETWSLKQYPFITLFMNDIYFVDNMHGWIATGKTDSILATTDGGENWFTQYVGGDEFNDSFSEVFFVNENVGWICGYSWDKNLLFKTTDSGLSWEEQFLDTVWGWQYGTFSIHFIDENIGWLSANISGLTWLNGEIFKTTNGGQNWTSQYNSDLKTLSSIKFSDENIGWAVGRFGEMLKTTDGGQEWNSHLNGFTTDLNSVFFVDENTGWAIGQFYVTGFSQDRFGQDLILKTTNRGDEWISQYSVNSSMTLNSAYFISNEIGWAVGFDHGSPGALILATTNGGEQWIEQYNGSWSLNDVFFINESIGWAVAYEGSILKTTNGGNDWFSQSTGSSDELYAVYFLDEDNGWAIGADWNARLGRVHKTTDGGANWITEITKNYWFTDVLFIDNMNGFIVGKVMEQQKAVLYKTTNAGEDWTEYIFDDIRSLCDIQFIDEFNGWALEGIIGGSILRTTNGGVNWFNGNTGGNSLYFVNQDVGWLVGFGGQILKTTNGGVSFVEENKIDEMPTEYSLSYNYPNPFNPSTKIKYSVPQTSSVVIKVFDILGSEIETLVNEEKPAGTYEITWSAEELPSGVYFYQLKAVGPSTGSGQAFIETKKMLLLK